MTSIRLPALVCLLLVACIQRGADAADLWQAQPHGPIAFRPSLSDPFPLDTGLNLDYTRDGTGMLLEMRRMLAISPDDRRPEFWPVAQKALLAWPLMGRGNRVELLFRPEQGIYTTYVKRACLRRLNKASRIQASATTIAIDTHVHTCHSPDSMADISQMLLAAARRGLAGVAITDHNTFDGAEEAVEVAQRLIREGRLPETFFAIRGEEVSSLDGHIIALFLTQQVPSGMSAKDTVEAIHAQGGLAIAAHPLLESHLNALVSSVPFDAVETHNADEELHYARARDQVRKRRADFYASVTKPRIGASDAHDPQALGACYTLVECPPDPQAVREAILAGKTTALTAFSDGELQTMVRHGLPRVLVALDSMKDVGVWMQRHLGNVSLSLFPEPGAEWSTTF